ncbi:helix-turn-helix transcriptional regulator [Streptomyces sp. GMY02]|uniref:helix-turn-helix domain-containing protein n=1 Tax=Streptomyces sp. GMY02 TaxID=1333528 RepID=UPI001C2C2ECF|nr:helix-turn-helix transcriptional regulator [Streptomyces sp. GMY02]QXE35662.1 helix-turn-helix transcriptional regulator [Streptomyces sp. GMY02]
MDAGTGTGTGAPGAGADDAVPVSSDPDVGRDSRGPDPSDVGPDSPDSDLGPEDSDALDFAARFRRVISVIYPKDLGRPWRDSEIAEGTGLSGTYIGNLRKGTQKPSLENAVKIAKFFGIPLNYFTDSATARAVERDLRKIEALRDARVERIAMRAAGLPPEMQDAALTVVEQLRRAVGLPNSPDGPDGPEA